MQVTYRTPISTIPGKGQKCSTCEITYWKRFIRYGECPICRYNIPSDVAKQWRAGEIVMDSAMRTKYGGKPKYKMADPNLETTRKKQKKVQHRNLAGVTEKDLMANSTEYSRFLTMTFEQIAEELA